MDIASGGGAILFGQGDGTFQGVPTASTPLGPAVVASFGQKHAPAIAVLSGTQLRILAMNGSYALSLIHTYALPHAGSGIVAADFNGDGNVDLAIVGTDSQNQNWNYSVLLGNADGTFQAPVFFSQSGALTGSIAVGDFNNDHKPDLIVGAGGEEQLAVLLGKGDGTFAQPAYSTGFFSSLIADFNGDGNLDIAASQGSSTVISYGNGDGTFQSPVSPASLNGFVAGLTADINNDGKADLVAYACTDCAANVALGNGDGTFTLGSPILTGETGAFYTREIADFNGDGNADYLRSSVNDPDPWPYIVLGDGAGGTMAGGGALPGFGSGLIPAFAADVNGDGRLDLVAAWGTGFAVVLNTTAASQKPDFSIGTGSPTSQTVSAGQTAKFTLALIPVAWFSGTVNLRCAITPAVTPAPTCMLSSSSTQIGNSYSQSVTVTVGTTSPAASTMVPFAGFPIGILLTWTPIVLGSGLLLLSSRKRRPSLTHYLIVAGLTCSIACGGNGSSMHSASQGTPSGKYSVTVTAVAGSLNHNASFQIVVQ